MSEEIPEDIMKAAANAWFEADEKIIKLDAIVVIAKAIFAERRRHQDQDQSSTFDRCMK